MLPPQHEEPPRPPVTAGSVAHDFFEEELEMHHAGTGVAAGRQAIVILQDDCYGHRYSRPRTSRANLSTIVERPERIHSSILGLATAYVRLGGRHAEGSAAPHPKRLPGDLPSGPFRIYKSSRRLPLKSPAVTAIHGSQWMSELANMCDAAESKLALGGKELTRPSSSSQSNGTNHAEKSKLHEGDLYLCSGSLDALEGALGGVCEGVDAVFQGRNTKRAFVCIRPPGHHCSADTPSGFCWLNNVHVGIGHAVLTHGLTHAAIIDFDLHHGDGSQSISWAHNARVASMSKSTSMSKKTAIGYFSLHDINSYPCELGDDEKVRNASLCIENAHGQTIWNVHLQSWKTEAEFWQLYTDKYTILLEKARNFLRLHSEKLRRAPTHPNPKAAIFLSAGFDASEWESPGMQRHQVNVPTSFYTRLTADVVALAEEEGLGVDGRVISVLEGGYSDRALMSGVLSHISGLTMGPNLRSPGNAANGFGPRSKTEAGQAEIESGNNQVMEDKAKTIGDILRSEWWSLHCLEEIEALVNPPTVVPPKKQRSEVRPTYTSATQSYTAKIVTPPQVRRSFSGAGVSSSQLAAASRGPSPPPPAVDWATAAYQLSRLLIPSDRETRSCKPEDLNAEASRARRDRYSVVGIPTSTEVPAPVPDPKRMQLRDRRSKAPPYASEDEEDKPISRASRRKTIADVSLLAEEVQPPAQQPDLVKPSARPARRRSSVASNASSMNAEKGSDFSLGSVHEDGSKRQLPIAKKSRAPSNPRNEIGKPKAVKKNPPVPCFPSTASTITASEHPAIPPASTQAGAKEAGDEDVDQLATGMRTMSIKLHVPPKEEYEARSEKSKAAPKGRFSKAGTGKAAAPSKPRVKTVKNPSPHTPLPSAPLPVQQLPAPAIAAGLDPGNPVASPPRSTLPLEPAASEVIGSAPSPSSIPQIPSGESETSTEPSMPASDGNVERTQGDTPGIATKHTILPESALPDVTNTKTPASAKRTKQDLPVFTSTSPILFKNLDTVPPDIEQTANKSDHTASVVDANIHESGLGQNANPDQSSQPDNSAHGKHAPVVIDAPPASIWDIPDTPQPRKP